MDTKLKLAEAIWDLTNIVPVYQCSRKAVFFAESKDLDTVILKINEDSQALRSEYEMLRRLDGQGACKVYGYDHKNGLLLEQRILPGTVLREEPSLEVRLEKMKGLFQRIHSLSDSGETYLQWLEKAVCFCRESRVVLIKQAEAALEICREMFGKYPERVLLHGDFHHDNLLRNEDGAYVVIDPKGVVGPEILELARFMMNEVDTVHSEPDEVHMNRVTARISQLFGYPAEDIAKIYYMETVLANVWRLEDGEPMNVQEMELAQMIMEQQKLQQQWKAEEAVAHIHGWDFSHIDGRYTEETDLPWSYRDVILRYLKPEMRILDIDTGGGEFLLSLNHPHENTAATEGYAPNVALCRETLLPLGVDFRPADGKATLPFDDGVFDMVIDRHGDFHADEIARVLKPRGLFITEQVGAENDRELVALLLGHFPMPFPEQYLDITREKFKDAGFEILEGQECFRPIRFFDVGALVWFARIIEWEFPGFSVETCRESLLKAQSILERDGAVEGNIHRFLLVARKRG